ncbi:MAG: hypothetical protein AAFP02_08190, partial [Bacteroidota bacterium]
PFSQKGAQSRTAVAFASMLRDILAVFRFAERVSLKDVSATVDMTICVIGGYASYPFNLSF